MWRKSLTAVMLCVAPTACLHAQTAPSGPQASLIDAWLALPGVGQVAWPYAYISADSTDQNEKTHRGDLFDQFDQLRWRLDDNGYAKLAETVTHWKSELAKADQYRLPGDWSPSWLMAHPNQRPPVARISSIGYCEAPDTVQVWDTDGVHQVAWKPGLRLSDLLARDPHLTGGTSDEVAIVWPHGDLDHYGVAAWNYADTELMPGTRVVGAIDLKGDVFPWMRDAIAGLLAHTPAGTNCRSFPLNASASHD